MEGDERRRHYEQSNYPRGYTPSYGTQGANVPSTQTTRRTSDGPDRFRQSQLLATTPVTSASLASSARTPQDLASFPYSQGQQYTTPQLQPTSFQYQSDYLQEQQRQRISHYPSQMTYNVPQQTHPQSTYDPVGQYQSRQSVPAEGLASQYGAPTQFYSPSMVENTSGPAAIGQQYQTTPYQQAIAYDPASSLERSTLASSYPSTTSGYPQAGHTGTNPQQRGREEEEEAEEEEEEEENSQDDLADAYDKYWRALGTTNDHTSKGRLVESAAKLREISNWLLGHIVNLGLSKDDETLHAQRIELWDSFNICFLALLQRQKDDTQRMLSGQPMNTSQSLLPLSTLQSIGDELIAHGDHLETLGLVDYQMGVSEQEIIENLNECIDLLSAEGQ